MIFFADAEKAAEPHDRKQDAFGSLVQHDVLDLTDPVAVRVLHGSAKHLARADGGCMT
jgi:hypothetical protein